MAIFVLVVLCLCFIVNMIFTLAAFSEGEGWPSFLAILFDILLILAIIFQAISL